MKKIFFISNREREKRKSKFTFLKRGATIVLYTLFFILGSFSSAYAADAPIKNAGFVPANIWYSKDPFFDGEKIRIYTIIFNGSTYDLEGTVEFLDSGVLIGKTTFSLSGGSRVRDVWIDWKATAGKHTITARIINTTGSVAGGKKAPITIDNAETGKSERDIDLDTDGDGVGNRDDLDDDGDGISDVDELRNGTDPLKVDTNGDGVSDFKELQIATEKKAEAAKLLAGNTEPAGTLGDTLKKVGDSIPAPVKVGAAQGANALEQFRVGEGYQIKLLKEDKAREIEAMKARTDGAQKEGETQSSPANFAEKPFAYVMLALLTFLQYLLEWQIVFYGVLLYIVYRIIRWGFDSYSGN